MMKSPNPAPTSSDEDQPLDTSSLKSIYTRNKSRTITSDFFLFSCAEEEQNLKSIPEAYKHFQRYPLFQDSTGLDTIRSGNLSELLGNFLAWFQEHYPHLSNPEEITYLRFGTSLSECTLFLHELTDLLRINLNNQIPPRSKDKEDPVWGIVDSELEKAFPSFAPFMQSYFQWIFRRNAKLDYDLGSLPPTGRFLSVLKRGPSSSRPPQPSQAPAPKQEPLASATEPNSEEPSEDELKALAEVDSAIAQLTENASLESVNLRPQNSFLRRKQHKQVVGTSGFESISIGEGEERALQVRRSSST